jgi:hypothetical protein
MRDECLLPHVTEAVPVDVGKCDTTEREELVFRELARFVKKQEMHFAYRYAQGGWTSTIARLGRTISTITS